MSAKSHHCTVCLRDSPAFADGPAGRPNARCPACDALERHRFVALVLHRLTPKIASARIVLDVAPLSRMRRLMESQFEARYVGLDISTERNVDVIGDATRLPLREGSVDLVINAHVLEHVVDDTAAIREMARTLHPDGIALVQVPFRRRGPTIEDVDAPVDVRTRLFGQADHVRSYGEDFPDRLIEHGLHPLRVTPADLLDADELLRYGIPQEEEIWLCAREQAPMPMFESWRLTSGRLVVPLHMDGKTYVERRDAETRARYWQLRYQRLAAHPLTALLLTLRRVVIRLKRAVRGRR